MPSSRFSREAERLQNAPGLDERPAGLGTVQFIASCAGDAEASLKRAKEIMAIVSGATFATWPPIDIWSDLLPDWFVSACARARTEAESADFMKWWRTLPPDEQAAVERTERWSLESWLYWMEPDNREWTWWDGCAVNPDTILIAVEARDWPFAWGALRWLFRAAGAIGLEAEE